MNPIEAAIDVMASATAPKPIAFTRGCDNDRVEGATRRDKAAREPTGP